MQYVPGSEDLRNLVVLVDEHDLCIGTMEKMEAHEKALLHRAFSVFLFNKKGEMLLQQRSLTKYHSAGLWTNACCSHPFPNEAVETAAERRLQEELGIQVPVNKAFSFVYKAPFENGLTEHEYDHVFVGEYNGSINFNEEEVMAIKYVGMEKLSVDILQSPEQFTSWFVIAFPMLQEFLKQQTIADNPA